MGEVQYLYYLAIRNEHLKIDRFRKIGIQFSRGEPETKFAMFVKYQMVILYEGDL